MHPTTASLSSRHGAEDIDDQFDFIEQDAPAAKTAATISDTARKSPHLTPKIAPPKVLKRYNAGELPDVGAWVVVTVQDGKRKETFQGRVAISDTNRLRLRQGAGWWEIKMNTVINITTGDDPAHRGR